MISNINYANYAGIEANPNLTGLGLVSRMGEFEPDDTRHRDAVIGSLRKLGYAEQPDARTSST